MIIFQQPNVICFVFACLYIFFLLFSLEVFTIIAEENSVVGFWNIDYQSVFSSPFFVLGSIFGKCIVHWALFTQFSEYYLWLAYYYIDGMTNKEKSDFQMEET
jgi:hypothetical protein